MALSCTFPSVEGSVEESTWEDQSDVIPVFMLSPPCSVIG